MINVTNPEKVGPVKNTLLETVIGEDSFKMTRIRDGIFNGKEPYRPGADVLHVKKYQLLHWPPPEHVKSSKQSSKIISKRNTN